MPTEDELRRALHADAPPARELDAHAVIRSARGRRRPKQVVLGSMATLAVVGIGYLGISTLPNAGGAMTASELHAGQEMGEQFDNGENLKGADGPHATLTEERTAMTANVCGQPVAEIAEIAESTLGLVVTTEFPAEARADGAPVAGRVVVTNTGNDAVTGLVDVVPVVVLSSDDLTVWHTNGGVAVVQQFIDLAPGESHSFATKLTPVACRPSDDPGIPFPTDLPPLGPGTYQVRALIDFTPEVAGPTGVASSEVLSGPTQDLRLTSP